MQVNPEMALHRTIPFRFVSLQVNHNHMDFLPRILRFAFLLIMSECDDIRLNYVEQILSITEERVNAKCV
jgi:hypothetical protein